MFSGIGVTAVAEFDHDIQPLLKRHRQVAARACPVGILEAGEYLNRFLQR
ncbi:MAG: hypothetical protein ACLPX8_26570 [Bryobacteraceae bacterium]